MVRDRARFLCELTSFWTDFPYPVIESLPFTYDLRHSPRMSQSTPLLPWMIMCTSSDPQFLYFRKPHFWILLNLIVLFIFRIQAVFQTITLGIPSFFFSLLIINDISFLELGSSIRVVIIVLLWIQNILVSYDSLFIHYTYLIILVFVFLCLLIFLIIVLHRRWMIRTFIFILFFTFLRN